MRKSDFAKAASLPPHRATRWYHPVEQSMMEFGIISPLRAAMYIATLGHESCGFTCTREIWGPTAAQRRYEGRTSLGNTHPGDGFRYLGRGLIQITGRANYRAVSNGLDVDYVTHPEWLERAVDAARGSGWWWLNNGCNEIADSGDFLRLSIRVNGRNVRGLPNGWSDRNRRYAAACMALGV
ncbi:glycoside hydrolase family 19 protein [Bordetella genomosp. 4]|uniref:glycoside hydrolase family 19 protein n=1 Tax=Bordetella genomosp. 4 TaxID=463044 RepID=UPI000BCCC94F|nr:glycoside hydrolase family 19 protein [Bordetella genomosp. 4]OZI48355.1 hypothetical protein CAL21_10845 [Bordetella genomosp. 4]